MANLIEVISDFANDENIDNLGSSLNDFNKHESSVDELLYKYDSSSSINLSNFFESVQNIPYADESENSDSDSNMLHSCAVQSHVENTDESFKNNNISDNNELEFPVRTGAMTVSMMYFDNFVQSVGISKQGFKETYTNKKMETSPAVKILNPNESNSEISHDYACFKDASNDENIACDSEAPICIEHEAKPAYVINKWEVLEQSKVDYCEGREMASDSFEEFNNNNKECFAVVCNAVIIYQSIPEDNDEPLPPEDTELLEPIPPITYDEENNLRRFLQSLNIQESSEVIRENINPNILHKANLLDDASTKRDRKRQEIENYFLSPFQTSRFLDVIMEETLEPVESSERNSGIAIARSDEVNAAGNRGWENVVYNPETNEVTPAEVWGKGVVWEEDVFSPDLQRTFTLSKEIQEDVTAVAQVEFPESSKEEDEYICDESEKSVEIILIDDEDSNDNAVDQDITSCTDSNIQHFNLMDAKVENSSKVKRAPDSVLSNGTKSCIIRLCDCEVPNETHNKCFDPSCQSEKTEEKQSQENRFTYCFNSGDKDGQDEMQCENEITVVNTSSTKFCRPFHCNESVYSAETAQKYLEDCVEKQNHQNLKDTEIPDNPEEFHLFSGETDMLMKNLWKRNFYKSNSANSEFIENRRATYVELELESAENEQVCHSRNDSLGSDNTSCKTAVFKPEKSPCSSEKDFNDYTNETNETTDIEEIHDQRVHKENAEKCVLTESTVHCCKRLKNNSNNMNSPKPLRELALTKVVSLPFGLGVLISLGILDICGLDRKFMSRFHVPKLDIIETCCCESKHNKQSCSVLNSYQNRTDTKKDFYSVPPIPDAPQLYKHISQEWVGMPTKVDPTLLVCLSPSQMKCFQGQCVVPTPEEAETLLDLHKKFIERRGYHEYRNTSSHTNRESPVYKSPLHNLENSESLVVRRTQDNFDETKQSEAVNIARTYEKNSQENSDIQMYEKHIPAPSETVSVTSHCESFCDKNRKKDYVEEESRLLAIIREISPLKERTKLKHEHNLRPPISPLPQSYQRSENNVRGDVPQQRETSRVSRDYVQRHRTSKLSDYPQGILFIPPTCRTEKCCYHDADKESSESCYRSANLQTYSRSGEQLIVTYPNQVDIRNEICIQRDVNNKKSSNCEASQTLSSSDGIEMYGNESYNSNRLKAKRLSDWLLLARGYDVKNISVDNGSNSRVVKRGVREQNVLASDKQSKLCRREVLNAGEKVQCGETETMSPTENKQNDTKGNSSISDKHQLLKELILQRRYSLPDNKRLESFSSEGKTLSSQPNLQGHSNQYESKRFSLPPDTIKHFTQDSSHERHNILYQRQFSSPNGKTIGNFEESEINRQSFIDVYETPLKRKQFNANEYVISKKGDIAILHSDIVNKKPQNQSDDRTERPCGSQVTSGEIFRQQMYLEYMNKVAEIAARRKQKMILISAVPDREYQGCKSPKRQPDTSENTTEVHLNVTPASQLEDEFMSRVRQRMSKLGIKYEDEVSASADSGIVDVRNNERGCQKIGELPEHLRELLSLSAGSDGDAAGVDGVWSPLNSSCPEPREDIDAHTDLKKDDEPGPVIWTPKSAGASPVLERKEFRPLNFQSPTLSRKNKSVSIAPESGKKLEHSVSSESELVLPPWKETHSQDSTSNVVQSHVNTKSVNSIETSERRIVQSQSVPLFSSSSPSGSSNVKLPKAQSPTITLLQKAREGQLPRGALYLDHKMSSKEKEDQSYVDDILYSVKKEYESDTDGQVRKKVVELSPKKYEGVGPVNKEGIPLGLRSNIKEETRDMWYKQMYNSLNRVGRDDDYVTIRYKPRRGQYVGRGYVSEPEPTGYDSDVPYSKYATMDLRRVRNKENDFTSSTLPHPRYGAYSNAIRYNRDIYKNQPGRIEDYEPGRSSISEKETKQFWDEVMEIFDEWLDVHSPQPTYRSLLSDAEFLLHAASDRRVTPLSPSGKSFMTQALKESGYESDSTLVFKRRDDNVHSLSPAEQKMVYKSIQKGGDVPLHGLRKPAPERPKEPVTGESRNSNHSRNRSSESPHKYVESEVTIHYKSPVRAEAKESLSEEELARRQAEAMHKIYQEEKRRKYLQELQDMNSRRHTDNFTPSQKSPIPLNRYDDFLGDLNKPKPRERTPEPKLVARALYNFKGMNPRELSFQRGDIIFIERQTDSNWYVGQRNAMIGYVPVNYVEIIPYDAIRSTPKLPTEGQARAKFNFIPQTAEEMSLVKGELIVLTERVDENWYRGRIGDRSGIFPVSYVHTLIEPVGQPKTRSMKPKPVVSPASHSVLVNGVGIRQHQYPSSNYYQSKSVSSYRTLQQSQMPSKKMFAPMSEALHIDTHSDPVPYRALYNYKPQNDDELELVEGDTVYVMEKCDDGWYVGSSRRTGHYGTFPGNYVERLERGH